MLMVSFYANNILIGTAGPYQIMKPGDAGILAMRENIGLTNSADRVAVISINPPKPSVAIMYFERLPSSNGALTISDIQDIPGYWRDNWNPSFVIKSILFNILVFGIPILFMLGVSFLCCFGF